MSTSVEIRPGSVRERDLMSLEHVISPGQKVGQTPRLVGPQGDATELPAEIYELLVTVIGHLRAGNASRSCQSMPSSPPLKPRRSSA